MTAAEIKILVKSIEKIDTMIENKKAEIKQLELRPQSCTSNIGEERVQGSSGVHDSMAEQVVKVLDRSEKLRKDISKLENLKDEIISTFEYLQVDEYDILHKKYVQYKRYRNLRDVAYIKDKSHSWTKTMHGNALMNLRKVQECPKLYRSVLNCTKIDF